MNYRHAQEPEMQAANAEELLEMEGVLQLLDTINRELRVEDNGTCLTLDVPPGCVILLNHERVKLRLLQPTDRVHVTYTRVAGRPTARLVEV